MNNLRLSDGMEEDAYLWEGRGPVDPEVARLEAALRPLRFGGGPLRVIAPATVARLEGRQTSEPVAGRSARWRLAVAAMVGLATIAAWFGQRQGDAGWRVERLAGAPTIASAEMEDEAELRPGQWLTTDEGSRARLEVAGLGDVRIEPGSRVRVKDAPRGKRMLELREGTIHAFIVAPPRVFLVDTPAARAVDLGCEYTLTVDESGTGKLRVFLGYVMLEGSGRSSTIPMDGGECLIREGCGPGTPYFGDAPAGLKEALERLDFERGGRAELDRVLHESRGRDALTLWHLLFRTTGDDRAAVYERLASLKPPPAQMTRAGALALDRGMLDAWWNEMRPF